jgi:hypothetical protein
VPRASLAHLEQLADVHAVPDVLVDRLRRTLQTRVDSTQAQVSGDEEPESIAAAYRQLRRDLLAVESAELNRLYEVGKISDATRRHIQHMLDLEDAGLED